MTLKSNVLLDGNGATVTFTTGSLRLGTDPATGITTSIADNAGNIAENATSLTGSNSTIANALAVGDGLVIFNNVMLDSRWGGTELSLYTSELVEVASKSGNTVNFKHPIAFSYTSASRAAFTTATSQNPLWKYTPTLVNPGVINLTVTKWGDQPLTSNRGTRVLVADCLFIQSSTAVSTFKTVRFHEMIELELINTHFRNLAVRNPSENSWYPYGVVYVGYTRSCAAWGVESYCQGNPSWNPYAHSHGNRVAFRKATSVDMTVVKCYTDAAGLYSIFDSHYTSARVRFIDCAGKRTATGVSGTVDTPGGGGTSLDGHQNEMLRWSSGTAGKRCHFRANSGQHG